ncbi:phospholipid-binding lipoprotein MlaA [Rivihabitans pingtungensis]|jgi:phospholipid-binding lipoprotein MlaA|uniref:Phospholipid-binding lipoprotein MlaA n=1 Tax=Rivihabitans pingtungensis TaxID=1054498 RepID=A0A318KS96_9NEIS|nr:phospholipid-binding lipoprotein MlaA [Rivihabitans pingtungensis]
MEWKTLFAHRDPRRARRVLPALLAVSLLAGCAAATPQNRFDPYEAANRKVHAFNDVVDRAALQPLARGYRAVTPEPARAAVSNVFGNLEDVVSVVNHLLQGQFARASSDLMRVALNSTLGLGGLIDIATPAGLPSYKTGFGETLGRWGYQNSAYVVLPLLGPSTVRDTVGRAADIASNPRTYLLPEPADANVATGVNLLSQRANALELTDAADEAALDKYSFTRDAYLQYRRTRIGAADSPAMNDEPSIDALVPPEAPAK